MVRFAPGDLHRAPYLQKCLGAAKRSGPRGFLYLCGTERLQRAVEEDLVARTGNAGLTGSVVGLKDLQRRYPSGKVVAPREEVLLRLWASLRGPQETGAPRTRLSFVEQVWDLLDTVRKEGDPAAAADEVELDRYLDPVEKMSSGLEAEGQEDPSLSTHALAERLREHPVTLGCLVVEGFESYPRSTAALVEALAEKAEEAWVLVEGEAPLSPAWEERGPLSEASSPAQRAFPLEAIDLYLRREASPSGPVDAPDVQLLRVRGGEREEVEAIARNLRELVREFPRASYVVALASLPSYVPRILETFPRFGLMADVRLPRSLLASPRSLPLRRLVEVVVSGYPRAGLLELMEDLELHGHLARFFASDLTSEEIDRRTREAHARQGKGAFTDDLNALGERWRQEGRHADAERADAVAEGFGRFFAFLAPLEEARTPVPFVAALANVLEGVGLASNALATPDDDPVPRLRRAAQVVEASLGGRRGAWSLSELQAFVETALSLYAERAERQGPGIVVTGLHDAGLVDVDYVFLGGLSEVHLPADRPSPLLSPGARARIGLPSGAELVQRERDRLARALARARKGVFLSYAARGEEGEVLPSLLLNDLLAVTRPRTEEARLARAIGGYVFSAGDAMVSIAEHLAGPEKGGEACLTLLAKEAGGPRSASWHALFRGLRVERERRRSPRATSYDGPSGGKAARELARRRFAEGRLGVRNVQEYLRCPYRFFLDEVLRLESPEELEEDVDRPALGTEVHRLLYEIHHAQRGSDGSLRPLDSGKILAMEPQLRASLSQFFDTLRPRTAELDVLAWRWLGPEDDPKSGALSSLLRQLADDLRDVRPAHIELAFDDRAPREGAPADPKRLPPLSLGSVDGLPVRLVGRIDRLGFGRARSSGLVVDDYKTGRGRPKDQDGARDAIPRGLELQLPLYTAAALAGFRGENPALLPCGMRYVWLSSPGESGFVPLLKLPASPTEEERQRDRGVAYVELSLKHAQNAAHGILTGRFPVNGRFTDPNGGCQFAAYCSHALGCRFDEARLGGEDPA